MKNIRGVKTTIHPECYSPVIDSMGVVCVKHQKPVTINNLNAHDSPVAGYQYVIKGEGKTFATQIFTGWFKNLKLATKGGFNALPAFGLELDDLAIELVVYKMKGSMFFETERLEVK